MIGTRDSGFDYWNAVPGPDGYCYLLLSEPGSETLSFKPKPELKLIFHIYNYVKCNVL
jgi:hypothetical protein